MTSESSTLTDSQSSRALSFRTSFPVLDRGGKLPEPYKKSRTQGAEDECPEWSRSDINTSVDREISIIETRINQRQERNRCKPKKPIGKTKRGGFVLSNRAI